MAATIRTTRLAPSPTGALHLGNARTFLINWALARQNDWQIVLRIEDLDTPRTKRGADLQAIDDLRWLGIDWDAGPFTQLADLSPYRVALDRLRKRGMIYPCRCTRRDIAGAQSAPHIEDHELRYPGTCRPLIHGGQTVRTAEASESSDSPAYRVLAPAEPIEFVDQFAGPQHIDVDAQVGDFVVATKAGLPAYQLAVVVDDARQGVTDIVRGGDLIGSAARQLWLYRQLDLTPLPNYWHLPLVLGPDGKRLAKRHGDSRLSTYRDADVSVERVIGLVARWCGVQASNQPMTAARFLADFRIASLPRSPIVFTPEDHAWLTYR